MPPPEDPPAEPPEQSPEQSPEKSPEKSYGNVDEHHWTRARRDSNPEAIEYYRERSKAPGVAEGGGPRNFYCMDCDGVIPSDHGEETCPHCGAAIEGQARRYFNWVEIDQPPESDLKALLPLALVLLLVLVGIGWLLWFLLS